jgi:Arm DNA-binding domain
MAKGKGIHRLSDLAIRALHRPGRHADGGGLYLSIYPNGAKSWTFLSRAAPERFFRPSHSRAGASCRLADGDAGSSPIRGLPDLVWSPVLSMPMQVSGKS